MQLLGSPRVSLGRPIDWHADARSGERWPSGFFRDIRLVRREDASDVKWPWELSRLQWLIPVAQAYLLEGDERHARTVREVLEEWIDANPYAWSVNWGCAMEAALRVFSWTYFFHVMHAARAWAEPAFRRRFLASLFLHGEFVERHLEWSDVNGNHFAADAAGLVVAGLFFGEGSAAERWERRGWQLLQRELQRQVGGDGADIEASTAYHRLVTELFLIPAWHRRAQGLAVPAEYERRLVDMAGFVAAYSRPDGRAPLWGDADDGRALPFGPQDLNDHRYLVGLVGIALGEPKLAAAAPGPRAEEVWFLGPEAASAPRAAAQPPTSQAFREAGVFVLRNDQDHVFVDAGPVGFAGRGGHGHNDVLSFEAVLAGAWLVADCGTFTYTGSFEERNRFRGTASHNTPRVDGEEVNRFVSPDSLWSLRDDARPEVRSWRPSASRDVLVAAHGGYRRLAHAVTPVRTYLLDHDRHALVVADAFEGRGSHRVETPLHLAPEVEVRPLEQGLLELGSGSLRFLLAWGDAADWSLELGEARISPRYGVTVPARRLLWQRTGPPRSLLVTILPAQEGISDPLGWAREALATGVLP